LNVPPDVALRPPPVLDVNIPGSPLLTSISERFPRLEGRSPYAKVSEAPLFRKSVGLRTAALLAAHRKSNVVYPQSMSVETKYFVSERVTSLHPSGSSLLDRLSSSSSTDENTMNRPQTSSNTGNHLYGSFERF
jgi:hypothetical protein